MRTLNKLYPLDKQSFKAFLGESFRLQNLGLASNERIANLDEFNFSNSIIYATNADREDFLKPSESTAHKNLAFSLVETDSHKKADLIKATRAINRAIPSYNIIFFLSPTHLSIAFAKRRLHKSRTIHTDIVEKITLIKDIDLAHPSQAHTRNLQSIAKIKPKEVDNYYGEILEALSISALNKEFYAKILVHFADFVESLILPNSQTKATQNDTTQKREFILRLLSRILFCKFLEKKGIISPNLWDTNLSTDYYHEVLEPLFFTTLNTPPDSRDYGFLPRQIIEILSKIPYLNGGLFSPQISDYFIPSNPHAYANALKIDNALFDSLFATLDSYHFTIDEANESAEEVALDPELLGQIFESLLSQLFTDDKLREELEKKLDKGDKNSLRKATGSYYTPREIVRYMVRSAILLYLQTHLKGKVDSAYLQSLVFGNFAYSPSLSTSGDKGSGDFAKSTPNLCHTEGEARSIPTKSNRDFSHFANVQNDKNKQHRDISPAAQYDKPSIESKKQSLCHSEGAIATEESKYILDSLRTLKILDPACGSGAFPMGILSEIIALQDLLGDTRPHYARKLEILQSCIYGIDIQPMATEIARLRCFLSLIVDENPSDIKSLPNLEFKFISANSLLPLPKDDTLQYDGYVRDMAELDRLRIEYFNPDSSESKAQIQKSYTTLRTKIANKVSATNAQDALQNPLLGYDPFNPHSTAHFFDSTYMFGVESFDIVIGNPPYISSENMPQVIKDNRHIFKTAHKKTDIYVFFYEMGLKLLKQEGIITYITSNKFLSQEYGLKLRDLFLQNTIKGIINFNVNVFENATVDTCILLLQKCTTKNNEILIKNIESKAKWRGFENMDFTKLKQDIFYDLTYYNFRLTLTDEKLALLQKISSNSLLLSDICFVSYGCRPCGNKKNPNLKKKDLVHSTPQGNAKPYIESKDNYLTRYAIHSHDFLDYQKDKIYNAMFEELFNATKLMAGRTLANVDYINFVYDDKGRFCNDSMCCSVLWKDMQNVSHQSPKEQITEEKIANSKKYSLKYLQGILNSKVIRFYVKELLHDGLHFYPDHQKALPIPKLDSHNQNLADEIVNLVDKILAIKAQDLNANIAPLESQIDNLVYQLYGLDSTEIQIIKINR